MYFKNTFQYTDGNNYTIFVFLKISIINLHPMYRLDFEKVGPLNVSDNQILPSLVDLVPVQGYEFQEGIYTNIQLLNNANIPIQNVRLDVRILNNSIINISVSYNESLDEYYRGDNFRVNDLLYFNLIDKNNLTVRVNLKLKPISIRNTNGQNAQFALIVSDILEPLINLDTEHSEIENMSYLAINRYEDQFNYIYRCLNGVYNKNKFIEISKIERNYNFKTIDYYSRLQKIGTYFRGEKLDKNTNLTLSYRDNYIDFSLIGSPNKYGITQFENRYLKDTSTLLNSSLISQLNNNFNLLKCIFGYTNNTFNDNRSKVYFRFDTNFSLTIQLFRI